MVRLQLKDMLYPVQIIIMCDICSTYVCISAAQIIREGAKDMQLDAATCRFIPVFLLEALGCPPRSENING